MSDTNKGGKPSNQKTGGDYVDGHHTSEDVEETHGGQTKPKASNTLELP